MAPVAKGALVAWEYQGAAQFGFVTGLTPDGARAHLAPETGRARLVKPLADLVLVLDRAELLAAARARA